MVLVGGSDSHGATRFEQSRVSDPGHSQSPLTNHRSLGNHGLERGVGLARGTGVPLGVGVGRGVAVGVGVGVGDGAAQCVSAYVRVTSSTGTLGGQIQKSSVYIPRLLFPWTPETQWRGSIKNWGAVSVPMTMSNR
jgi:hypothetical protein